MIVLQKIKQTALSSFIFLLLSISSAQANTPTLIGQFQDWTAYTSYANGGVVCFMSAKPKLSQGNYTSRGQVYAFITHRKSDRTHDVVSFITGYTYEPDSTVTVTVDNARKFQLFTQGDTAWGKDGDTDRNLVNAIRTGNKMVVTGTSSRGTSTIDTYSLRGTSQAYNAITKACN